MYIDVIVFQYSNFPKYIHWPILYKMLICRFKPRIPDHLKEDFHLEPLYAINGDTILPEGLKQSLFITKSVIVEKGLPRRIYDLAEKASYQEQDALAIQV